MKVSLSLLSTFPTKLQQQLSRCHKLRNDQECQSGSKKKCPGCEASSQFTRKLAQDLPEKQAVIASYALDYGNKAAVQFFFKQLGKACDWSWESRISEELSDGPFACCKFIDSLWVITRGASISAVSKLGSCRPSSAIALTRRGYTYIILYTCSIIVVTRTLLYDNSVESG